MTAKKAALFFGLTCLLCQCKTPTLITPNALSYSKEESYFLSNGLILKYLVSEQFGISARGGNTLLAVEIKNTSDSSVWLRQTQLQIKTSEGMAVNILNPKLSVKQTRSNRTRVVYYTIKEFGVAIERLAFSQMELPVLNEDRNGPLGVAMIGAVNMGITNIPKKKTTRYFQSSLFGKEIKPHTAVYGLLLIEGRIDKPLNFLFAK